MRELMTLDAPGPDTPWAQHLAAVRASLQEGGLPTSAPDVRIVVSDIDVMHGGAVLRTATGESGLAPEAESHLMFFSQRHLPLAGVGPERAQQFEALDARVQRGDASITDVARLAAMGMEDAIHNQRHELWRARLEARTHPTRPTVVNMSWGTTTEQQVSRVSALALKAPPGSPLAAEVERLLGRPGRQTFDDLKQVAGVVRAELTHLVEHPQAGDHLRQARARFGDEVLDAAARDRVFVVQAAANQQQRSIDLLGHSRWSAIVSDVEGTITVGATTLGDPRRVGDEQIAPFSSNGDIEVAAPGVRIPVYAVDGDRDRVPDVFDPTPGSDAASRRTPQPVDGTSFAAPYVSGVVALMLQANPNLSLASIHDILRRTSTDIAGARDGAGVVDPAAAVRAAREAQRP